MTDKPTYEELELSEKALLEVESTVDWVWSVDIKGIHIFTNKSIEQHLGYKVPLRGSIIYS